MKLSLCILLGGLVMTGAATLRAADTNVEDASEFDQMLTAGVKSEPWGEVSSDTRVYRSTNIQLLPDNLFYPERADTVVAQTFTVRLQHHLSDAVLAELILRYQLYRYLNTESLDFNTQSATFQLSGEIPDLFRWYGNFTAQRQEFVRGRDGEFFKMYNPEFGIWRDLVLNRHLTLFGGYQLDWRPSSPGFFDRVDNTLYAGCTVALLDRLSAQLLYRLSLHDYTNYRDRFDVNQLGGITLFYTFCANARVELFVNYIHNDSNLATRDYDIWEGGGALRLSFNF